MRTDTNVIAASPPKLIATIIKGFNIVASRVHLIIIPVVVDLILWLGPKLRLKSALTPALNTIMENLRTISSQEILDNIKAFEAIWNSLLEQFNLFTLIRTIPIGVPSLIARESSIESPLKFNMILETTSVQTGIAIAGGLLFAGFFLGALYFNLLSRYSDLKPEKFEWKRFFSQYAQTLLLFVILLGILVAISIPLFIFVSFVSMINVAFGQVLLMVMLIIVVWILVPLIFSPHGIFTLDQKAFPSLLLSLRLVRFFLPAAGLFVITCALISEGLNFLWTVPEPQSWLTLLGIGGHAFVVTALISASFSYYRDGIKWMKFNIQRLTEMKNQQENGGASIEQ